MEEQFCVVSIEPSINNGLRCLESFARIDIWKSFEVIGRGECGFGYWDLKTAKYALEKYANKEHYNVLPLSEVEKEFNIYKTNKHAN